MKVENHNGLGNEYHDDRTGQFTSANGGSTPHYTKKAVPVKPQIMKKAIVNSNGQRMNINPNQAEKDLKRSGTTLDEVNMLKEHNMLDQYKQKYGSGTQTGPAKINLSAGNSLARSDETFSDVLKDLSNTMFVKMIKFALRGFDFNAFKNNGSKLNRKIFAPKKVQEVDNEASQKQINKEKMALRNEGMQLINDFNQKNQEIDATLQQLNQIKETYQQKFGKNEKMFENWFNKSNLKKHLIKANHEKNQLQSNFDRNKIMYKRKMANLEDKEQDMNRKKMYMYQKSKGLVK